MLALTNAQIRALKAQAQRLKATLKIGKEGVSPQFLAAVDDALKHHELVKVKFDDFKEQKQGLDVLSSSNLATSLPGYVCRDEDNRTRRSSFPGNYGTQIR
jgi:RNA-binding protein